MIFQYDGQATEYEPPHTATFDPAKRRASLRVRSTSASTSGSGSSGQSIYSNNPEPLAHVSHILSTVATILGKAGPAEAPTLPLTPSRTVNRAPALPAENSLMVSPPANTPSKLKRYLKYAEKKLGVTNATDFEFILSSKGYGPDILHCVKEESLVTLGISPGDVIRLQDNALKWWNGPDAKRKHVEVENDDPGRKHICFEKRYRDESGKLSLWGSKLVPGDIDPDADYDWWYFSEAHDDVVPIPQGYLPLLDFEDEATGAPF